MKEKKMKMSNMRKGFAMMLIMWLIVGVGTYLFAADTFKRGLGAGEYYKNAGLTQGGTDYQARSVYCDDYNWVYVHGEKGVGTDTQAVLIDLSDTTNYKHDNTGHIILKDINSKICLEATGADRGFGRWTIRYGLQLRSGATDGDVLWFYSTKVEIGDTIFNGGGHCFFPPGPGEIDLAISDNQAKYITGGVRDIDDTDWDNDDAKVTFISTEAGDTAITARPGEGDVVVDMINDGGSCAFNLKVTAIYRTQ